MKKKKKAWNMSNPLYRYLYAKPKRKRGETMVRRKATRRSAGFGVGSMNKWLKIAAFSTGAVLLGSQLLPNVDNKVKAAVGGYAGGGLLGAVAGYIVGDTLANFLRGSPSQSSFKTYGSY